MLVEDARHLGTETDVSAHVLDIIGTKEQIRGLLDTGGCFECYTKRNMENDEIRQKRPDRLKDRAVSRKQGDIRDARSTDHSSESAGTQSKDEFSGGGESS